VTASFLARASRIRLRMLAMKLDDGMDCCMTQLPNWAKYLKLGPQCDTRERSWRQFYPRSTASSAGSRVCPWGPWGMVVPPGCWRTAE
jgi:hypothetical protein